MYISANYLPDLHAGQVQGFFQVPQNTDIVSFSDSRRNAVSPIRIRGGRAGETLTLPGVIRYAVAGITIAPDPAASPRALRVRRVGSF